MTLQAPEDLTPRAVARFMAAYSKQFNAGGFASPTAQDLAGRMGDLRVWREADAFAVALLKRLSRPSTRRDFTGGKFALPAGARVVEYIAQTGYDSLEWEGVDYAYVHPEDPVMASSLSAAGWRMAGAIVRPTSEIITCMARPGLPVKGYSDYDRATLVRMPWTVPTHSREGFLAEIDGLSGWRDDVPFYNAGAWGSLSLRGFWPDDPTRGSKPAEMAQAYKRLHPEDADRVCDWTVLAGRCPGIVAWVREMQSLGHWRVERVRLVRLVRAAGGELSRHTDGTRDDAFARIHIPLVTDPRIKMETWTPDGCHRRRHLEEWGSFYLDTAKPHRVRNETDLARVHLVVDVRNGTALRGTIARQHRAEAGDGW